jgi:hypothetical protein
MFDRGLFDHLTLIYFYDHWLPLLFEFQYHFSFDWCFNELGLCHRDNQRWSLFLLDCLWFFRYARERGHRESILDQIQFVLGVLINVVEGSKEPFWVSLAVLPYWPKWDGIDRAVFVFEFEFQTIQVLGPLCRLVEVLDELYLPISLSRSILRGVIHGELRTKIHHCNFPLECPFGLFPIFLYWHCCDLRDLGPRGLVPALGLLPLLFLDVENNPIGECLSPAAAHWV